MSYTALQIEAFLGSPAADDEETWRDWITAVLLTLQMENDSFSGKRPLGNSDWWWILAAGLSQLDPEIATTGTVYGEDGTLDDFEPDPKRVGKAWKSVVKHIMTPM